ncbi:MAG TPA: SAM-dependent methyltransferase [Terriglobia bacterium]|nr:SAM-dependent methyltransferase [Terriglobia bacterium]
MPFSRATLSLPASFRDPAGFLFYRDAQLLRQINAVYQKDYDLFIQSGLYEHLTTAGQLVVHEEVNLDQAATGEAYKVLKPDIVDFVSYPYEWCFSQLKDAALLTLKLQREALSRGMCLKDASAYNIQFLKGRPVFIDTLSFQRYREGEPWVAYRQFCQHFLAPLVLMSYRDFRLNQLLRVYLDGIPLDLTRALLPRRTLLRFSLLIHIHLHARIQEHFLNRRTNLKDHQVSRRNLLGLLDNLESAVAKTRWPSPRTEWSNYDAATLYGQESYQHKLQLVAEFADRVTPRPRMLWDLGANTGTYSWVASERGIPTIAFDADAACVEYLYGVCVKKNETHLLPLVLDLTNPSPGLGWENQERMAWSDRGPADATIALALVHHLAISNNLPLTRIAEFFHTVSHSLLIEFVPKSDKQVELLLSRRMDTFPDYTRRNFEEAFNRHFVIGRVDPIRNTDRVLYWMQRRSG